MTAPRTRVDLSKVRAHDPRRTTFLDAPPPTPANEWILDFPYATTPISPNGPRKNHYVHAREVKTVRLTARYTARSAKIPHLAKARAELTWFVLTNHRRDPVNLTLTLKAMVDGLVDAGVVDDDTPNLMDTPMPTIVKVDPIRNPVAWMELRVTPWEGLDPAPPLGLKLRTPPTPPEAA